MRDSVRQAFVAFTERFEGKVPWMYLDVKGLVTVAIGNLIDPMDAALGLPFVHADGTPASRGEIASAWSAVKARTDLALRGGGSFASVSTLRLTDDGIAKVVLAKLSANEARLAARFAKNWNDAPADAQLAVHSMAWASGAAFNFPKFQAAFLASDWDTCARQCHMEDSHNPGLVPRNAANVVLFGNAVRVKSLGLDPSVLYYPGTPTVTSETA